MKTDIIVIFILLLTSQFVLKAQAFDLDTIYNCPSDQSEEVEYYVLDFWATWCKPCVLSLPHFNQVRMDNEHENFKFISVTNEDIPIVKKFMQFHTPINNCIGIDEDFSIMHNYGHKFIPIVLILDKQGNLQWEGDPFSLTNEVINSIASGEKITREKPMRTKFEITGPSPHDTASVMASIGGQYWEFKNNSIDNVYRNVLSWNEGRSVKLSIEGKPKHGYAYSCRCEVDTNHYNWQEFTDFCLQNLNSSLGAKLESQVDTLDYYTFTIIDTAALFKHSTNSDSTYRIIEDGHISWNKYPLKYIVGSLINLYHLDSDFDPRKAEQFYELELDVSIENVDLDNLKSELQKIGLSFTIEKRAERVYTLVFK